jgi:predicted flap endonuclease-1-like 5' DNA nuclease
MATKLEEIEGIGPAYAAILREKASVKSVEALLEAGGTRRGRQELSEATGIAPEQLLSWVNMADLFRINGVGEEFSHLLEEAGVDTIRELAQRVPENLYKKMVEVNEGNRLANRNPTLREVEKWVAEAKTMEPKVSH